MKKIITLFLLLVFMLCGCNQPPSEQNQSEKNQQTEINNSSVTNNNSSVKNQKIEANSSQNQTTSSNTNNIVSTPKTVEFDFSTKTKAQNPMSLEEVKAIFEPLLEKSISIQGKILNDGSGYEILNETPIMINGIRYYHIRHELFETVSDVWDYVYSVYTKESAERIFAVHLDQQKTPRFLEKDGKLYCELGAHGRDIRYSIETLNIIEQYEDTIVVSIDFTSFGDEIKKSVYVISNSEATWKMCNSENESFYVLPKQFLK